MEDLVLSQQFSVRISTLGKKIVEAGCITFILKILPIIMLQLAAPL